MDKKVTIYDIAREAGVSTATVTRVTSGDPRVKASTREKVQRVIDAHAYTPSAAARDLEGGSSKTLAIVLPQILNPYFTRMFDAANAAAVSNGYTLWLFQAEDHKPISRELVDELIQRRFAGAVFAGNIWGSERSGLAEALARLRHHMPVVAICPPATQLDCICIHSDLVGCSRLPVRHLHTLGHRRIAFIGGSMQFHDYSKRGENFLEELRVLGLPDNPAYHIDCGYDAESGERAVIRMLSGLPRSQWPTAMIAFNDLVALGALKQIKKMGLRVPEDMSLIGCDNQFFCPYTDPPLTSVELYPEEMAQSAVRELLFARDNSHQSFSLMREASLIVRESCGATLGYRKLG